MLKLVYFSLTVLNMYRCVALIWFHHSTGLVMCFNVKVKNIAFDTSKVIRNAWFSMKNYFNCSVKEQISSVNYQVINY